MPVSLADYDLPALEAQLTQWGAKPLHAPRLLREYYLADGSPDLQTIELPRALRDRLTGCAAPLRAAPLRRVASDGTVKLALAMRDGALVEAVLMSDYRPDRAAACVSSQIGCAMGCDFCASARGGLSRNLEAGEIVEQFLALRREAAAAGRRITSLVFMGMGEPMHNLDNVIAAIGRIAHPRLGNLGARRITVSTVGIVPGMDRLAEADLGVHLALSLHAPDDATRARIMPMGRRFSVAEVLDALRRFALRTGRIPTVQYCLLAGVNDADDQADQMALLLGGLTAHVNLIPYNAIGAGLSGAVYRRPAQERIDAFARILSAHGVVVHVRRTRGDDVAAACGQLARVAESAGT
jgi:23S rRNA (adenine2503-C2)-methyltransferase